MKKHFFLFLVITFFSGLTTTEGTAFRGGLPDYIFGSDFEPCNTIPIQRDFVVDEFEDSSGLPWGQATGASNIFPTIRNRYTSQSFTTPMSAASKRVVFENGRPSEGGISPYTVTISTCPGDFSRHLDQPECKVFGQTPALNWTTDPNNTNNRCILEQGRTYYLNIVHSLDEASNYALSSCSSQFSTCGVLYAEIF